MGEFATNLAVLASHDHGAVCQPEAFDVPGKRCCIYHTASDFHEALHAEPMEMLFLLDPLPEDLLKMVQSLRPQLNCPVFGIILDSRSDFSCLSDITDRLLIPGAGDPETVQWAIRSVARSPMEPKPHKLHQGLQALQTCYRQYHREPRQNMNALVQKLGQLLKPDMVLYNRLDNGMLRTWCSWQLPENMLIEDNPQGHICFDVIQKTRGATLEIHNLSCSPYAQTDPSVLPLGLQTYLAKTVWSGNEPVGSLCCIYTRPVSLTETERSLLEITALLMGTEEERLTTIGSMERAERRYRDMLDNLPAGIYRTSLDGQVLEANRELATIMGYEDKESLLSVNVNNLFREKRDRETWTHNVIQKDTGHHSTYITTRRDGSLIWVEDNGRAVKDEQGNVLYFEGVMTDITSRIELEEAFRQAQKMDALGRLAGGFAHEFNNLLTVINGYTELLQTGFNPTSPQYEQLKTVLSAGTRAAELVKGLLAFSRKQLIQPVPANVVEEIQRILGMIRSIAGLDITVTCTANDPVPEIRADRDQLEQVILNLCLNAISAIRDTGHSDNGTVDIRVSQQYLKEDMRHQNDVISPGLYVVISIIDNGVGIPAGNLSMIFEPFFTTREVGQGSGLGLAAVHGIVLQNGGITTVDSLPGNGSTFRVYWPAYVTTN